MNLFGTTSRCGSTKLVTLTTLVTMAVFQSHIQLVDGGSRPRNWPYAADTTIGQLYDDLYLSLLESCQTAVDSLGATLNGTAVTDCPIVRKDAAKQLYISAGEPPCPEDTYDQIQCAICSGVSGSAVIPPRWPYAADTIIGQLYDDVYPDLTQSCQAAVDDLAKTLVGTEVTDCPFVRNEDAKQSYIDAGTPPCPKDTYDQIEDVICGGVSVFSGSFGLFLTLCLIVYYEGVSL